VRRAGILVGAICLGLCANAHSQSLSLGLSSGGFFPKEQTYRDIYGASLPLEFEVRVGLFKNLGLAAGVSYVGDSGEALNIDQGQDSYPVRFRMVSFPLSAFLLFPLNGVSLLGGAGVSFHSYEETWQTVSISNKGNSTKPFVYGGVEFRVLSRVAARLTLRYETISSGENPLLANEINLGGLTVLAGVSVRVF
jgi:opacity protein-like surface antigen